MQNYEFRCRKLSGDYLAAQLGEYGSLIDALEDVASLVFFDHETESLFTLPPPDDCRDWAVISADGMEVAAVRNV